MLKTFEQFLFKIVTVNNSVCGINFIPVLQTCFQFVSSSERPNCLSVGYKSKFVGVKPSAHIILIFKFKVIDSIGFNLNALGEILCRMLFYVISALVQIFHIEFG